ncbi:hypothetical protein AM500_17925 [Bacillus sp. FJAT-18017]|uniref:VWA domain-containing protein n=1 Tax=Bacillus sp. FJAT-18017 TaxID=1705566 RepID=UPI0006AEC599|nr:VWA domain-containing protein [Bacillus sp. FJAT-18017]ALC91456.1 hypothetical protein AM500_17925 [Bacillus sp. FJAT-18017]
MKWLHSNHLGCRKLLILTLVMIFTVFSVLPANGSAEKSVPTATKAEIEQSILTGQSWLTGSQNEDGSWGTHFAEKMRNTSEITKYLTESLPNDGSLLKSSDWLKNQETANFDFMARTLSQKGSKEVQTFFGAQSTDGGWGLAEGYDSDVFDTALVLGALLEKDPSNKDIIQKGIAYLIKQQKENGSWGYNDRQQDSIFVTAQIILLLNEFILKTGSTSSEVLSSLIQAGDFILSLQQEDQTWGLEEGTLLKTLMAYQAVLETNGLQPVGFVHDTILQLQEENGSWANDPYITLWALKALNSHLETTSAAISAIELYKVTQSEKVKSDRFEAYEMLEINPIYESSTEQLQVQAFIKTPAGKYETVQAEGGLIWNTQNRTPGDYTAVVQIKNKQTGKVAATSQKSFEIVPSNRVDSATILLSPEKTTVGQSKEVNVQLSLFHSSNVKGEATQKIEVYSKSGELVASQEKVVSTTPAEPNINTNMLKFTPEVGQETTYTIKGYVYKDGKAVTETEKKFEVLPPPPPTRIDAEQALNKEIVNPGSDTVNAEFVLKGLGAPTEPERKPLDMIFVIDTSGSMDGSVTQTKEATKKLMELIQPGDRGGVIFFDYWATVIQNLTPDINLLKKAADKAYASGGTSIDSGINSARSLFKKESNSEREKVIVLLSDGQSSRSSALTQAKAANGEGITIHTIGLGNGVDKYLMEQIAIATEGTYRFSPTAEELEEMMNGIGGEVFNLAGKNVVLTTTLPSGITVDQTKSTPAPSRVVNNANGTKTVEWNYDIIVMNQTQSITLALKGTSFSPGETEDITTNTKLTYTAKSGEQIAVPLPNMQVKVNDSLQTRIQLNDSDFTANENAEIHIEVENNSDQAADLQAVVEIVDNSGGVVSEVGTYPIDQLAAKGIHAQDLVWNTGNTYTGDYAVKVTLVQNDGQKVSEATAPFTIVAQGSVEAETTTDKAEYQSGQDVVIQHHIENGATNKDFANLAIKTTVLNSDNQSQFEDEIILPYLSAQEGADRSLTWKSGQALPGKYTVKTEVWDGDVLVSSDETVMTILSTADLGYGLEGTLTVGDKKVISGKPVDLNYTVTNTGNSAVKDAKTEVLVIQPETGQVVKTFEDQTELAINGTVTKSYSYNTKGLKIGNYLVVLRTTLQNGEIIALDSGSFSVDVSIEVSKLVKEGSRILVWTEKLEANTWIEKLVKESDYATVVTTAQDFMKELRSNKYNVYLVSDTQQPLTGLDDQELLAKIHNGHRLIATANANLANFQTFNPFGAKLNGTQTITESSLSSKEFSSFTGTFGGALQKYDLTTGETWATLGSHPAIVANEYGNGVAVHVGFDSRQLQGLTSEQLEGAMIKQITPKEPSSNPGDVQMVEIKVKSNGGPIDVQLTEVVPEGIRVIDPMDFTAQENNYNWKKTMEPDEEITLHYLIANPMVSGHYSLVTENGLWDQGEFFNFESKEFQLEFTQSEETLLLEAVGSLKSASISSTKGKGLLKNLSNTLRGYLVYQPKTKEELELAIEEVKKGLHVLANESDQDALRFKLERVLSLYQSNWYTGGRKGS